MTVRWPFRRRGETSPAEDTNFARRRARMVEHDLAWRDITDPAILEAMGRVPRHRFVPPAQLAGAYGDHALPIGHHQTISQPYVVALMTQLAGARAGLRALDVGTGSGYQAAVLAELGLTVKSVEIVAPLADEARRRLEVLGYTVEVRRGDGAFGWPEAALFDVILVAAAPRAVPAALVDQLAPGGRLVLPMGEMRQTLVWVHKRADGVIERGDAGGVRFVPMTGAVDRC